MTVNRKHWLNQVREVIRSRHYTWLPQGLGGEPVEEAMTYLVTDIMHICQLSGISMDDILERARAKFEREEAQFPASAPPVETSHPLSTDAGEEIVVAFESNDVYEAEIARGLLQAEGIPSRVDSTTQGGFTELVDTKVLIHARDAERAQQVFRDREQLDD